MKESDQKRAAKKFVERWITESGYEKGQTQMFWTALLRDVFGVAKPEDFIEFEDQVKLGSTKFIDARIPSTKVLIEQKGAHVELTDKVKQSDGSSLTPFEQAHRYVLGLPVSEHPRWIVVCNFREFHVHDMERPSEPPQVIRLEDLEKECYRLRFLVDSGRSMTPEEMQVSVAAGKLVGEIYDALLKQYKKPDDPRVLRSLNILCVRLVFCLYAEDAGLFNSHTQFHDYLESLPVHLVKTGLTALFKTLNTREEDRDPEESDQLNAFPYVNGGLFSEEDISIPQFNQEIVDLLLSKASAGFDWSQISPTIFGAVFESTLNPETRRKGGMHYTSVDNIHKVIDPLFFDDLQKEFADISQEKSTAHRTRKLKAFQNKLAELKFLDPACGSGNFLTETYISLRRLENDVIRAILGGQALLGFDELDPVKVSISQFYGIEINDFAVSVAQTALWIAESQMLKETEDIINRNLDFFPLKSLTSVVEANALKMQWEEVVPIDELNYIMGNPPFVGARYMSASQKQDLFNVFGADWKNAGDIDYVGCWFKKAADCMTKNPKVKTAFVATNSICQGMQVANLWAPIIGEGALINFAWRTFVWDSKATAKAHVHCVIVGFSKGEKTGKKKLFDGKNAKEVQHINAYLLDAPDIFIYNRNKPICDVPEGGIGNKPIDGGNYLFTEQEKTEFIQKEPASEKYFKKWWGSDEFISGVPRYCLWLGDCPVTELAKMPLCKERIEAVKAFRLASKSAGTIKLASTPRRFHVENMPSGTSILIPEVSSEKRKYVPMGFMQPTDLCSNLVRLIPNASKYHFGVLTSSVHMAWMRAVCGRLEMRYRYSINLVYNNFPWPENVSDKTKKKIEKAVDEILQARAAEKGASLATLYDKTLMPEDLSAAHAKNDQAVLEAYGFEPDLSEAQIIEKLFALYQKQVAELEKKETVNAAVLKVISKQATAIPDWLKELRTQCLTGAITADELIAQGKAKKKEIAAAERKAKKKAEKIEKEPQADK